MCNVFKLVILVTCTHLRAARNRHVRVRALAQPCADLLALVIDTRPAAGLGALAARGTAGAVLTVHPFCQEDDVGLDLLGQKVGYLFWSGSR